MKRLTSILLLLLFVYNFIGAGLVYNLQLYTASEKAKIAIEKEQVDEVTIIKVDKNKAYSSAELQWHEEHEFRYRGQMYDIIKKEQHGDKIWFYCYWDKEETEVMEQISDYVSDFIAQHSADESSRDIFVSVLDKLFLSSAQNLIPDLHFEKPFTLTAIILPLSLFPEIESPPPRLVI